MVSNKTARKSFAITKRGECYDVKCLICGKEYRSWDWRGNALNRGYAHSYIHHDIESDRGVWASRVTLYADWPPVS